MLVDPVFKTLNPELEQYLPKKLGNGLYISTYCLEYTCEVKLLGYHEDTFRQDLSFKERMAEFESWFRNPNYVPDYGMCDDPDQFLRRFPQIITSPTKYIVAFTLIEKKHEPEDGGLRFHKNGEYYGERNCEGYEYFVDEPDMDHVCVFEVFEVTDEPNTDRM